MVPAATPAGDARDEGRGVRDRREAGAVGRSARLELVFGVRDGRTVLVRGYAEPPLRVGRPLTDGADRRGLHLILASSAPGIFGNDTFEQHVIVEAGASVRLTSQSALQVHPSIAGGTARIRNTFVVEDGGELQCEWEPVIPFANSHLDQRTSIRVAPGGRLAWSDALMAGREGRGERWQFASLRQELRVMRGDVLEYLERYQLAPSEDQPSGRWVAHHCCYFGTWLAVGYPADAARAEALDDAIGAPGLHAAVDCLGESVMLARMAASGGPVFHDARRRLVQGA